MNSIVMNNISYHISSRCDNFCDKLTRKLCCCRYKRTYKHGDAIYNNITNFVHECTKYANSRLKQSLLNELEHSYDSVITLINLNTLHIEYVTIILNITRDNYDDDYITLYGSRSLLERIELNTW